VASNQLTSLSDCFQDMTKLKILNAASNLLTTLPTNLNQLVSLQTLIVSGNSIKSIQPLSALTRLIIFDLSNNQITGLFWSFRAMANITMLDIHNNHFYGTIPTDWFDQLPQLTNIDLSQNSFTGALPNLANDLQLVSMNFGFNQVGRVLVSNYN
jgi:Leucine-rich repeat (LRR) protein